MKHFKKAQKSLAHEWIKYLFNQADIIYSSEHKLGDRYVALARRISQKYKVKIPRKYKRRMCKHCYCYLRPGANARVRVCGKVVIYCERCKKYIRIPLH